MLKIFDRFVFISAWMMVSFAPHCWAFTMNINVVHLFVNVHNRNLFIGHCFFSNPVPMAKMKNKASTVSQMEHMEFIDLLPLLLILVLLVVIILI